MFAMRIVVNNVEARMARVCACAERALRRQAKGVDDDGVGCVYGISNGVQNIPLARRIWVWYNFSGH